MKKIIFAFLIFFALIGCVAASDVNVGHKHPEYWETYHNLDNPTSLDNPWGPYRPLHTGDHNEPGTVIIPADPFSPWGSGNRVLW